MKCRSVYVTIHLIQLDGEELASVSVDSRTNGTYVEYKKHEPWQPSSELSQELCSLIDGLCTSFWSIPMDKDIGL